MPSKKIEIPEPTHETRDVAVSIYVGPPLRVEVRYTTQHNSDATVWEDNAIPGPVRGHTVALLQAAIAAAKGEWGY